SLIPGVEITAIKHPHSAAEQPDLTDPNGPYIPTVPVPPNYEARLSNPPLPQDPEPDDGTTEPSGAEGGSVLYQFRIGDFALTYHDTTGPVKVGDATWKAMSALPPSDIQIGAVVNFGQLTNGMRDVRILVEALRPKIFIPNHHDDWDPALGSRGDRYERPVSEELNKIPPERRPALKWIVDPQDYLDPDLLTWDPIDPAWQ
ncbi:MAG: MBL fold metallo-hydrolase, partial [Actinomycetota bacterium]